MATNKRDLKAYVRYDGTGRVISGSLVLRRNKPKVGNWKEVQGYECCNPSFTTQIVYDYVPGDPDPIVQLGLGFLVKCGEINLLSYNVEYPPGTNTIQEAVDYLNTVFTGLATFSVVNSFTASVTFSNVISNALCPSGTLTIEPTYPA